MRILLDENFPKSAVDVIEAAGHEVIPFVDVCEFGADDEVVFESAQNLGAVILTSDRDFYHTVPLIHPEHCGIIVVALRQPNRNAILTRLQVTIPELPYAAATYCRMANTQAFCAIIPT